MKNYSLKTKENFRRSRQSSRKKVIYILLIFLVLVWFKPIIGWFGAIVSSPVHFTAQYIENSSAVIPTYIRDRSELNKEKEALKDELASYRGLLLQNEQLESENRQLRSLLGASTTDVVTAGVMASPPYSPYDSLVLDRGSRDGIVSGAPVYYGSGLALGYVRAVYPSHALVSSFTSPRVETTVYIYGPDIFTTAYGEGGGVLRISVPQGIEVSEGNLVVLPGLNGGVLGGIDLVQSIPTEPEQHAYVTLEVPLRSIRLVSVGDYAAEPITFDDALEVVEATREKLFTFEIPEDYQLATSTNEIATSTEIGESEEIE